MIEKWDAYNKDLNKIEGVTLIRGEQIPDGYYHLVVEVIVKHQDGSYLLMQRDKNKHFGLMWEATAGGSVLKNETPYNGIKRELFEETGIKSDEFAELGIKVEDINHSIYYEYSCITNCNKDSVTLQFGETIAYRWVSLDELLNLKDDVLVTKRIKEFYKDFIN